ncbi:head maturation protease, ClpP-related [Pontibacter burrus]|uniref:ATP-dependent Clp protease proteolytic subunit n=1 Tax=Pontibacter burrus TaxID=2704466 RepID=A0A6B3LPR1_9BACT|nr:head maturation protease, ClpP-related [Pontibacter burrus]NEM96156.1 Clp protease ClpP [Pontibacter burrus]
MAKHVHIPVIGQIGEYEDEFGWIMPGFTAQQLDWFTGYDVNGHWTYNTEIEHITLHIDSPGGDVYEGYAIYNKLLRFREQGITVEVHVEGLCASVATIIALAASPGKLKMREASEWMTHKPMIPEVRMANSDELRELADSLESLNSTFFNLYARKTGKTVDEIKELLKTDSYMSAEEAKAYGFVDEIITGPLPEAIQTEIEGKVKAVAFYNPKRNPIPNNKMAITKEEKSLFSKFKAWLKDEGKQAPKPQAKKPTPKPKAEAEEEEDAPEVNQTETADGAIIYHEGELEQGTEVFADAELSEALEDGEYELADERTIEVVDGAVANITEAEEGEEEEAPEAVATKKPTPKAKAKASQAARILALENELAELKQTVPGSGKGGKKGAQSFVETPEKKVNANNPLSIAASNASKKRN